MQPFLLPTGDAPRRLLAVGAHPDDVEIGAGGTLLTLAAQGRLEVRYVLLTGTPARQDEARQATADFLPGAEVAVELHDLPEGRLPARWAEVKDVLEGVAAEWRPDLVLSPRPDDAHQDHRTIGRVVPTVFRDATCLAYEIPKWDGDLGRPTTYVPLAEEVARRKVELLDKCFPSQQLRDWWDEEVFLGLARLRGMECRTRYAEAFVCQKWTMRAG